jgi:hypothetical protein
VQLWATWLLYAVLVDLTDAVAERLGQPMAALSQEMLYRGLSHFTHAFQRGVASDVVEYLAAQSTRLGILMRKRTATPSKCAQLQLLTSAAGPYVGTSGLTTIQPDLRAQPASLHLLMIHVWWDGLTRV